MTAACGHFDFTGQTPRIREIGMGVAALRYIELGCSVLPLERGQKKPHHMLPYEREAPGGNGVHHASSSAVQAEGRWSVDPAANVGVATGQPSRLVVLDLDVKHGAAGPQALWSWLSHFRMELPEGPWAVTPSGGIHLWMRTPPGVPVADRPGILTGVDVKGDGGLVVAPPSMQLRSPLPRPGEPAGAPLPMPYYWQGCPCQAPLAPPWLLSWIATAPSASGGSASGQAAGGVLPELAELRITGIPRGQRNSVLYRLACQLYRKMPPEQVIGELRAVWDAGDRSDMDWREVLVIAESARRFIEAQVSRETALRARAAEWLDKR